MWFKRAWMIGLVLPWLIFSMSGCSSVRFAYNQGSTAAYWWLDSHVDFSSEQSPRVRAALDEWFAWHRATQLGDYAALLVSAGRQAADNVTPAQVCRFSRSVELRLTRAFEPAAAPMAEIVRGLSAAQLRHLEQHYAKGNAEWQRDHVQQVPAERQAAALKRWVERAESFYGTLDDAQRRLVAAGLASSPFDAQRGFEERRLRQQDILRTLRQLQADRADAAATEAALRAMAQHMVDSPRADYRALRERASEAQCALVAQLHNTTTPAQRASALRQIKSWEDDLRALAGPVKASAAPARATMAAASSVP